MQMYLSALSYVTNPISYSVQFMLNSYMQSFFYEQGILVDFVGFCQLQLFVIRMISISIM